MSMKMYSAVLGAMLVLAAARAATTDPVGGTTALIAGSEGTAAQVTYVGLTLARPVAYECPLSSLGNGTLSVAGNPWGAGQFVQPGHPHYVEFIDGDFAGATSDILGNTSNRLDLSDNLTPFSGNVTKIAIRRHWTLADLFGSANEAGLASGSIVGASDEVILPNSTTHGFDFFYYKTGGYGGDGWRKAGNMMQDAGGTVLYPETPILVRRKSALPLSLKLAGAVKQGAALVAVEPGYNWLANFSPVTTTVTKLKLYTGDTTQGLVGGATSALADELLLPDGAGGWVSYFYKNGGAGGIGWRQIDQPTVVLDDVAVPAGSVVIINRKFGGAFNYVRPQLF